MEELSDCANREQFICSSTDTINKNSPEEQVAGISMLI